MNDVAKAAMDMAECAADRYGTELDACAEILQKVHPVGKVKAIGRLEVAEALRQVLTKWIDRP